MYTTHRTLCQTDRQFDVVYTGVGAICWLPDIKRWAEVVTGFLKPGGTFYILEGDPLMWSVSDEGHGDKIVIDWPYFESAEPLGYEEMTSYVGSGTIEHTKQYNFSDGLGETINALIQAGLVIDFVHEHKVVHWQGNPIMVPAENGLWKCPTVKKISCR